MSHAITVETPLQLKEIKTRKYTTYSCSGTPADCVKLAIHEILDRKPDLLLSGINHGTNTSTSIIYSGTMAAAIEGCLNGIPSIGFSVNDYTAKADFSAANKVIETVVEKISGKKLPPRICLNINIPAIEETELKGIKICRQADGQWEEDFVKRTNPNGKDYFWLTGKYINNEPEAKDTDEWALKNKFASIVPIYIDYTARNIIPDFKLLFKY